MVVVCVLGWSTLRSFTGRVGGGVNCTPRANSFWRRPAPCRQPPKAASPGWPPWAQYGPGAGGYLAYQPYSRVSVAAWSTRSNTMSRVACAKRAIIPAAHRVHSDHSLSSLEYLAYSKSRHLMCFLVCSASTASTGASRYDHALRFMMVGGIVSGAGQIKLHKEAAEMLQRCVHAFA